MPEETRGEVPQTEQQDETIKNDLERELTNLNAGQIYPLYLIHELESAGETRFTADLLKTQIDQAVEEFKKRLETDNINEIESIAGHLGIHTSNLYDRNKDKIPETETALVERGKAILNLSNVYYGDRFEQAISYYEAIGLSEQAKKVQDAIALRDIAACDNQYDASDVAGRDISEDEFRALQLQYSELRSQLIKEEMERLVELFDNPLLGAEAKKNLIEQIKTAINERLAKPE